jgi:5-methylcytosine-specific restriction enzyme B
MAFAKDESVWDEFLKAWPLERLRTMALEEYTLSGNKETFTYWIESRLDQYGSIWGGSAFKFAIYSRNDKVQKAGDTSLAYTDDYAWYRRFGDTPQTAFEAIRIQVVAVAEAARHGRLEEVDNSELGQAYRWKIAFHYQDRTHPRVTCVFSRKPLLAFLGLPLDDKSTPTYQLQQKVMERKPTNEPVTSFGADVWRQWVASYPLRIELTQGAITHGYLSFNLLKAPFPETMYGDRSGNAPGEMARFRTDQGETFNTDIRAAGSSGRMRHRFGSYFASVRAIPGDVIEVSPDEDGGYVIAHIPKNKQQNPQPMSTPAPHDVYEGATDYVMNPVNRILFGPPGTGKTFRTVNEALAILDPSFLDEHAGKRTELKARFDELVDARRIRFVTFHQSFSYEDFVEGIRADSEGGQLQYRVEPGVFRGLCEDAGGSARVAEDMGVRDGARIWKISIDGTTTPSPTREYCFQHGQARIGWSAVGDLHAERLAENPNFMELGSNDRSTLHAFSREIEPGDVLLCIGSETSVQAIGVVQGEYDYEQQPPSGVRNDYVNTLPVKWLAKGLSLDIRPINEGRQFTLKTVYEIARFGWPELSEYLDSESVTLAGTTTPARSQKLPYVLIIDEINRGNISRIFGELITLIEPSKRKGALEALEVVLPYSKKRFGVPSNVHLIGTMNTADRSLAGLDVALRRRFEFVEVMPDPSVLAGVTVEGVPIDRLLTIMNQRIEVLMGRDYMLGHAYFLDLKAEPTIDILATIFREKVLPLLQEYFYENWQKIAWVLNDHRKSDTSLRFLLQPVQSLAELFGDGVDLPGEARRWQVNESAFGLPDAYHAIIQAT